MHAYAIGTGTMARCHEQSSRTCAITRLVHVYSVTDVPDVTDLIHGRCRRGRCVLYISRVNLLLSSLYHSLFTRFTPYRNKL